MKPLLSQVMYASPAVGGDKHSWQQPMRKSSDLCSSSSSHYTGYTTILKYESGTILVYTIEHKDICLLQGILGAFGLPVPWEVVVEQGAADVHGVGPLADDDAVSGQELGDMVEHGVVVHGEGRPQSQRLWREIRPGQFRETPEWKMGMNTQPDRR